jgi:tetratricopeptide (TPR) repeat protein
MDLKAKSNLDALEAEAEDLVLQVIETGDYEEIVDLPEPRSRVQSIARRLASLEGYVVLQDIDLHPYSRLVKGIEQFLDGNITAALHTLRHAAQDSSNRQLQRFSLYWAAKLNNAVGNHDHALHLLDQALELLGTQESIEKQEMRRLHLETEFFQISEEIASDTERPLDAVDRFKSVKRTLVDLADVSQRIQQMTKHDKDKHAHHEVAINLADIYSWIAYRPEALCNQLDGTARKEAEEVVMKVAHEIAEEAVAKEIADEQVPEVAVEEKVAKELARIVQDHLPASLEDKHLSCVLNLGEEAFRAWVMLQAKRVFPKMDDLHSDEGVDFSLIFGRAECDFALGDSHDVEEYKELEGKALEDQVGGHREHRWTVELAQIALISKVRLLRHAEVDRKHVDVDKLRGEVDSTYIRLQSALHGAPDHNVNIFSHLQRRNLDENSFRKEATSLKDQAKEGLHEYLSDEPSSGEPQAPGEGA